MATSRTGQPRVLENPRKLVSWKSIAAYFDCDQRTAKRWEHERGLPVHRAPGGKRSGVFAYPSELDSWLRTGDQEQNLRSRGLEEKPEAEEGNALSVALESRLAIAGESALNPAQTPSGKRLAGRRWPMWTAASVAILLLAGQRF